MRVTKSRTNFLFVTYRSKLHRFVIHQQAPLDGDWMLASRLGEITLRNRAIVQFAQLHFLDPMNLL